MNDSNTNPLQQPREGIDAIDAKIVRLLGERWKLVEQVTQIKKTHDLPPLQPNRFAELLAELKQQARQEGVPEDMIEDIWNIIHKYSRISQGEHDAT